MEYLVVYVPFLLQPLKFIDLSLFNKERKES